MLRFPATRRKVNAELDKVRLDLEESMVPRRPDVCRHLALSDGYRVAALMRDSVGNVG